MCGFIVRSSLSIRKKACARKKAGAHWIHIALIQSLASYILELKNYRRYPLG